MPSDLPRRARGPKDTPKNSPEDTLALARRAQADDGSALGRFLERQASRVRRVARGRADGRVQR
ncbi:MAG: hypothetical protein AAGG01_14550, partial [Planctomycetota bacterium]